GLLDPIDDRARHEDLMRRAVAATDVARADSSVDPRPAEIERDSAAVGCWARRSVGDIDEDLDTPVPAPAITSATLHRRGLDACAIGEGAVQDQRPLGPDRSAPVAADAHAEEFAGSGAT